MDRNDSLEQWDNERLREIAKDLGGQLESSKIKLRQLFDAYIKTRLDYSGSWGNLSKERRREVIIHEIEEELGWKI